MAPQRKPFPRLFLARAEPFRLVGEQVFLRPPERGDPPAQRIGWQSVLPETTRVPSTRWRSSWIASGTTRCGSAV